VTTFGPRSSRLRTCRAVRNQRVPTGRSGRPPDHMNAGPRGKHKCRRVITMLWLPAVGVVGSRRSRWPCWREDSPREAFGGVTWAEVESVHWGTANRGQKGVRLTFGRSHRSTPRPWPVSPPPAPHPIAPWRARRFTGAPATVFSAAFPQNRTHPATRMPLRRAGSHPGRLPPRARQHAPATTR
jgi:hypothetical protein